MKYDVFLSFRGEDTRRGFVAHLDSALRDHGIDAFLDDRIIKVGEKIDRSLLKAIKKSRYCLAVISVGYANSKWCLIELAEMFRHNKQIIPVFYYVDPSDVRHQRRPFDSAFAKHERQQEHATVEEWRRAMRNVGQLKGYTISSRSETTERQVIQKIIQSVCGLDVADHLVGVDSRVEEVIKLLSMEKGGIEMVGMYGTDGVGKTTLAKKTYNKLLCRFDNAVYIPSTKDRENEDELTKLQQYFISAAFEGSEGMAAEIKRRFRGKKVLAVLDDVDDSERLKTLADRRAWFGEGTRILIITNEMQLLNGHGVHRMYRVHPVNREESLRVFCLHAFGKDKPDFQYMEISWKVTAAAEGIPLLLKKLGSSLAKRIKKAAGGTLKFFSNVLPKALIIETLLLKLEKLKLSMAEKVVGKFKTKQKRLLKHCRS